MAKDRIAEAKKLRKALQARIREIQQELGLTTIFVTHDQDEAMVMSDVIQLFHAGRIEQAGSPVEVYTKPVSEFAASFIGSYNQMSREEFRTMTGEVVPAGNIVAIRPETIGIFGELPEVDGEGFVLKGTVEGSIPRGNVLRYTVRIGQTRLRVDALFRSFHMFDIGDEVFLFIPEHDCLRIPAVA